VGQGHGHRALADGPGDALGRAVADVARGEQAGDARLEGERVAVERPVLGALAALEQVGAGEALAGAGILLATPGMEWRRLESRRRGLHGRRAGARAP
jgi:hypothetical protein